MERQRELGWRRKHQGLLTIITIARNKLWVERITDVNDVWSSFADSVSRAASSAANEVRVSGGFIDCNVVCVTYTTVMSVCIKLGNRLSGLNWCETAQPSQVEHLSRP